MPIRLSMRGTIVVAICALTGCAYAAGPYGPMGKGATGNPYAGAYVYVNPAYAAAVEQAAEQTEDETLAKAMRQVAGMPTAVWLERIAAIAPEGGGGLEAHLKRALEQWKRVKRRRHMALTLVLYNLPGRDCAASASNGELPAGELERYKTEFIAPVVEILGRKAYRKLRVVVVLEPDSLPNLVTNMAAPACAAAAPGYREGITYAIQQLSALKNVHLYLDIGGAGWLGWEHTKRAAGLYREIIDGAGGPDRIRGFATNVSGYTPTFEAFDAYADIEKYKPIIDDFYQWNRLTDEISFIDAFRALLGEGYEEKGFIVDTARNGWAERADRPSDARMHRGNWCNVSGAGLGKRPQVTGVPGVDAWVWIKPPGESDGTDDPDSPDVAGKRYDPQCGPGKRVPGSVWPVWTNALPGAPHAGEWFQAHFERLVRNAQPPLQPR